MRISDWSSDVCSSDLIHGKQHPSAPISLREIDNFLHGHMKSRGSRFRRSLELRLTPIQRQTLDSLSFERGFVGRRMVRVGFSRFSKLKQIWRNVCCYAITAVMKPSDGHAAIRGYGYLLQRQATCGSVDDNARAAHGRVHI